MELGIGVGTGVGGVGAWVVGETEGCGVGGGADGCGVTGATVVGLSEGMLVEGALLGEDDGDAVGSIVGISLGSLEGNVEASGVGVGSVVGNVKGVGEGARVGTAVGRRLDRSEGLSVGDGVGRRVGRRVGLSVFSSVGKSVGLSLGISEGSTKGSNTEGSIVGSKEGSTVGCTEAAVGGSVEVSKVGGEAGGEVGDQVSVFDRTEVGAFDGTSRLGANDAKLATAVGTTASAASPDRGADEMALGEKIGFEDIDNGCRVALQNKRRKLPSIRCLSSREQTRALGGTYPTTTLDKRPAITSVSSCCASLAPSTLSPERVTCRTTDPDNILSAMLALLTPRCCASCERI